MSISEIVNYVPKTPEEEEVKNKILALTKTEDKLFSRENEDCHFTTATLILSQDKEEVLLIHHKLFNSWTWPGGHNDGEEDFKKVALKEAQEETGLHDFQFLSPEIQSLDIFPVAAHEKAGKQIKAHDHLNVAYILIADEKSQLKVNEEETNGVRWWPLADLLTISNEPIMAPVYHKLLQQLKVLD